MRYMKMLETKQGSPNGAEVKLYLEDESYWLPPHLADAFESEGWAEEVSEEAANAPAAGGEAEPNLGRMTKTQLVEHGKSLFGDAFTLEASAKKAALIAEIKRLAAPAPEGDDGEGDDEGEGEGDGEGGEA